MVNQGGLGEGEVEKGKQSIILPLSAPVISADSAEVDTLSKQPEIPFSDTMAVHRIQEEHLRVWIAPYQDAQGNLHEGSIVHTVLKPGSWQIRVAAPRVSDTRIADPRVADPNITDANTDDPEVTGPQSSNSEEYP